MCTEVTSRQSAFKVVQLHLATLHVSHGANAFFTGCKKNCKPDYYTLFLGSVGASSDTCLCVACHMRLAAKQSESGI